MCFFSITQLIENIIIEIYFKRVLLDFFIKKYLLH